MEPKSNRMVSMPLGNCISGERLQTPRSLLYGIKYEFDVLLLTVHIYFVIFTYVKLIVLLNSHIRLPLYIFLFITFYMLARHDIEMSVTQLQENKLDRQCEHGISVHGAHSF